MPTTSARVVNAYASPILPHIDVHLHLVASNRDHRTVCGKDMSNRTMIPLGCFGKSDGQWCQTCIAWTDRMAGDVSDDTRLRATIIAGKPRNWKATPQVIERLRKLVEEGHPISHAARFVGISEKTAGRYVQRSNRRYRFVPPEKVAEAKRIIAEGSTQREACRITGLDPATLCRAIKRDAVKDKVSDSQIAY